MIYMDFKCEPPEIINIKNFRERINNWNKDNFIGDCPIDAQYALDLIFRELIDTKGDIPYLTTIPESRDQTNSIMLHMILAKYDKKYRRMLKKEYKKR